MFKVFLGFDCPGCGITRAIISIGQLKIDKAIQYNPASLVLITGLLIKIPIGIWTYFYSKNSSVIFSISNKINIIVVASLLISYLFTLSNKLYGYNFMP
ncbi:MAG: DUF2752 domain-containing protein [Bacteroidetes bacterium]|nr:DUF2752 domain-containing protein [Bacteroidota bacterium]